MPSASVMRARPPAPAPADMVARARAMIPALQSRAPAAEAARRIPVETIADLSEAGFFRMLQPHRWGGSEMDPRTFFEVQRTLAEGCMSTAWVFGVLGGHSYALSLFPDAAQRDVWGADPSTLLSSSYQPVGQVTHVPGGYRLSGRWAFSSGCDHCQWVLLGALVPPELPNGTPDMRTFLVPRHDYSIDDTWQVFGLKATGSQDIVVNNAFVPEHRTHRAMDSFLCQHPGQAENDAPLFSLPWPQLFVRLVSTASIGATRGAVRAAVDIAQGRVSATTGKASKSDPLLLNAIARAYAALDEMEVVLDRNLDDLMRLARAGDPIPLEKRALYRYQSANVVRRCADLVDELMPLLGGDAIYLSSPIVRRWLDLNAARAHVANDPGNFGPDLAQGLMGEPPAFMFL